MKKNIESFIMKLIYFFRYVLIITKSEMIIFHCFCCFWASLGLIPWAIAHSSLCPCGLAPKSTPKSTKNN